MYVPEMESNFKLYDDGNELIGITTVDAPSIQALTSEVKGAGIGGTISKVVIGMFDSLSMTFHARMVEKGHAKLLKAGRQHLECWAGVQVHEDGKYGIKQHKIIVEGEIKNLATGKHAVGEAQERNFEMEIHYYKDIFDGEEMIEIDKYNLIYKVNGEDQLAELRKAIGM